MCDLTTPYLEEMIKNKTNPKEILYYIRSQKLHCPELVHSLFPQALLTSKPSTTTMSATEYYSLLEQVLISTLHLNTLSAQDTQTKTIQILLDKFGDESSRVKRLQALIYEANCNPNEAKRVYHEILATNPANLHSHKRLYVIERTKSPSSPETFKLLISYLTLNQADVSAWHELSKLYMNVGNFEASAFCMEEVVMFCPLDAWGHGVLGEVYYCISGNPSSPSSNSSVISALPSQHLQTKSENTNSTISKTSRAHFAESLNLDATNLRALLGLQQSSLASINDQASKLYNNNGGSDVIEVVEDCKVAMALIEHVIAEFEAQVKEGKGGKGKFVETLLKVAREDLIEAREMVDGVVLKFGAGGM